MNAPVNLALYKVLVRLGATESEATAAVESDLVTKGDLDAGLRGLKSELSSSEHRLQAELANIEGKLLLAIGQMESRLSLKLGGLIVAAMVGMTGIFAIIDKW